MFQIGVDNNELNIENDWVGIYPVHFGDHREWNCFQFLAFASATTSNTETNSTHFKVSLPNNGTGFHRHVVPISSGLWCYLGNICEYHSTTFALEFRTPQSRT